MVLVRYLFGTEWRHRTCCFFGARFLGAAFSFGSAIFLGARFFGAGSPSDTSSCSCSDPRQCLFPGTKSRRRTCCFFGARFLGAAFSFDSTVFLVTGSFGAGSPSPSPSPPVSSSCSCSDFCQRCSERKSRGRTCFFLGARFLGAAFSLDSAACLGACFFGATSPSA